MYTAVASAGDGSAKMATTGSAGSFRWKSVSGSGVRLDREPRRSEVSLVPRPICGRLGNEARVKCTPRACCLRLKVLL